VGFGLLRGKFEDWSEFQNVFYSPQAFENFWLASQKSSFSAPQAKILRILKANRPDISLFIAKNKFFSIQNERENILNIFQNNFALPSYVKLSFFSSFSLSVYRLVCIY